MVEAPSQAMYFSMRDCRHTLLDGDGHPSIVERVFYHVTKAADAASAMNLFRIQEDAVVTLSR